MKKSLVEHLDQIDDFRRGEGQRHELTLILLIIIMATINGYHGIRAMGDFVKRNREELIQCLKPTKNRLPSYSTIRRVLIGIDFEEFANQFYLWSKDYIDIKENEWISVDGKSIKGTMIGYNSSQQHFINLISIFTSQQKMVLSVAKVSNSKESEIPVVQQAIKMLDIEGVVFSLDALHCQKKRQKS